jgi:hypothetical protein
MMLLEAYRQDEEEGNATSKGDSVPLCSIDESALPGMNGFGK